MADRAKLRVWPKTVHHAVWMGRKTSSSFRRSIAGNSYATGRASRPAPTAPTVDGSGLELRRVSSCFTGDSRSGHPGSSWHRIVAALGEWMAAADPLETHPGTAEPAVLLDRFVSVLGAGGEIPTAASAHGMQ